jgi:hypothetical protein
MKATIEKLTIDNFELKNKLSLQIVDFCWCCDIIIVEKMARKT